MKALLYVKTKTSRRSTQTGYEIRWTYDPLESRTGHLNIAKLGAICCEYIESAMGEMKDTLNNGMRSDRFHVEWHLDHPDLKECYECFSNLEVESSPLILQWRKSKLACPCGSCIKLELFVSLPFIGPDSSRFSKTKRS